MPACVDKLIQPDDEGNGDVGGLYNQQVSTWRHDFENGVCKAADAGHDAPSRHSTLRATSATNQRGDAERDSNVSNWRFGKVVPMHVNGEKYR